MEMIIKRRYHVRQALLVGCGQLCFLFIQTAEFFDQQYIWKESIDILEFLHGEMHQEKVAPETTSFGWVRLGLSHIQYSQKNSSFLKSPKTFLCCFYFDT